MRTIVTFGSGAFNTSHERDDLINPGLFGDDACRWIIQRLRERGVETDAEPGQEDFGWYFNFRVPEGVHCFVLGFRPPDADGPGGTWIGWVERRRGFLGSVLGGRSRGIAVSALQALHQVLVGAAEIQSVRWHEKESFDRGQEDAGRETPDTR